jgi:hypothetical protein
VTATVGSVSQSITVARLDTFTMADPSNYWREPEFMDETFIGYNEGGASTIYITDSDADVQAIGARKATKFLNSSVPFQYPNLQSRPVTLEPGRRYMMTAKIFVPAGFTGKPYFQIMSYNRAGTISYIGASYTTAQPDGMTTPLAASFTGDLIGYLNIPSDSVYCRLQVACDWGADWNTETRVGYCVMSRVKVQLVAALNRTVARNDGTTLLTDALAVTSLGTAAAITGQGSLATKNVVGNSDITAFSIQPSRLSIATDNLVADPTYQDTSYWPRTQYSDDGVLQEYTTDATICTALSTNKAIRFYKDTVAPTNSVVRYPRFSIGTARNVRGGDTYYIEVPYRRVGALGYRVFLQFTVTKSDGTYSYPVIDICPATTATDTVVGTTTGRIVLPAGAVLVSMDFYIGIPAGAAAYEVDFQIGKVQITLARRFSKDVVRDDGSTPVTDAAAITSLGTSAAITGQGALATQSSLAYGGAYLSGFGVLASKMEMYFGDGYLKETTGGVTASLANFKTSSGTAAAITGQGAWATYSALSPSALSAAWQPGQNALVNGSFKHGLSGWSASGWNYTSDWRGMFLQPPAGATGTFVATSTKPINTGNGGAVTISASFIGSADANNIIFCDVEWHNGNDGALLNYSSGTNNGCLFSSGAYTENSPLKAFAAVTAPNATDGSGFVRGYVRLVHIHSTAYVYAARRAMNIKVEVGANATPFTDEATLKEIDPSQTYFRTIGSIATTIPDNSFSYTSTTSSVTISWPAMTVYRADGTTVSIGSGSQAVTGLASATTYKIYPYVADSGGASGSIAFVTGGSGSPGIMFGASGSAAAAASMYGQSNIPMGSFQASTTASGSGGGGGGGSSWCLHPETPIFLGGELMSAGDILFGDLIETPDGYRDVVSVRRKTEHKWVAIRTGEEGHEIIVTPSHVLYRATGEHIHASDLRLGDLLRTAGDHVEVTGLDLIYETAPVVIVELEEPHLYFVGATKLLSHNSIQKP